MLYLIACGSFVNYMYDYFEVQKDGKDFVYCQKDEETGKVIKVTIREEK